MKDLIVVSFITERRHLLDEYEGQLRDAEIDFHIEPVSLPDGIGSITMRWRLDYWRRMCAKFSDYDRIVFTDAWDVLFYGSKTELCSKIPPVLMSAERNCWPDESLASPNTLRGPWKYPNPGMMAGYPETIDVWCDWCGHMQGLDAMDQLWCNRFPFSAPLDTRAVVFYVVSADSEDKALQAPRHRPWNSRYGTFPHFFHFAGPCHPDPFRAMLRGEVDAL
jgi:hypothetical protein